MAFKAFLVVCVQALFIQSAFSACTSCTAVDASRLSSPSRFSGPLNPGFTGLTYDGLAAPAWAYDKLRYPGTGCGRGPAYDGFFSPAMEFTATGGGDFSVTSSSAMAPVGISIQSENIYDGALNAAGELPFVGTTAFDSVLATAGSGAVNYACGNGLNSMSALSGTSTPASVATASPVHGNGLSSLACGANVPVFAYDRLMAPGFAAPVVAYNAVPYAETAWAGRDLALNRHTYDSSCDAFKVTPTSGGALAVSSASAIPPTGIVVASDNSYEGALAVGGELPFVGTVGMEGVVPSAGTGTVNHACGNGRNAMISANAGFGSTGAYTPMGAYGPAATFTPNAFAPGFGTTALGCHGAGRGCGCAY